jgi:hypothetical protein
MASPGCIIGKGDDARRARVGIKVIVDVHAIDVVTADNVLDDVEDVLPRRRLTGIEPKLTPDPADPSRMTFRDMICG